MQIINSFIIKPCLSECRSPRCVNMFFMQPLCNILPRRQNAWCARADLFHSSISPLATIYLNCKPRKHTNLPRWLHFKLFYLMLNTSWDHGLSQHSVWVPFWTPKPLKRAPQDTQIFLCGISKNPNLKLIIDFFHLHLIPMILFNVIMPYFDEFKHVYGWNMSILWSPLKIWTPKNFTTANFRHPVSKSWLRHCLGPLWK